MRALIQRVNSASVTVENDLVSSIGKGLLVLIGITSTDTEEDTEYIVRKVLNTRLFSDDEGKAWKCSVVTNQLEILFVSQFTLFGIVNGNKLDFHNAMAPAPAKIMYDNLISKAKADYNSAKIKDGVFGAYMQIDLSNDGPVSIWLDSRNREDKKVPKS